MREIDVRRSVHALLESQHAGDNSLILDELAIGNGRRRVDVAVVNGELTGYEIKSAADRLDRLPGQTDFYNRVFDRMWLVVASQHLDEALRVVPDWWGVALARTTLEGVAIEATRSARINDDQDPITVAQLLWRDEAIELLNQFEVGGPQLRRGSRRHMYHALAEHVPLAALKTAVRAALKARSDWR